MVQNSDNAANRRSRGYQIFVMDADGGKLRLIANTKERGTAPRWSPDGKKLVFISMLSGKNTDKVRDGEGTVTNTRGACAPPAVMERRSISPSAWRKSGLRDLNGPVRAATFKGELS